MPTLHLHAVSQHVDGITFTGLFIPFQEHCNSMHNKVVGLNHEKERSKKPMSRDLINQKLVSSLYHPLFYQVCCKLIPSRALLVHYCMLQYLYVNNFPSSLYILFQGAASSALQERNEGLTPVWALTRLKMAIVLAWVLVTAVVLLIVWNGYSWTKIKTFCKKSL